MKRKLFMVGNAHIDVVWLWRWQEGLAEIKATFRSALDRMKEFPDFVFTCACASYYQWVEQNCPEMFEEVRQRVKEGRWVLAGGWWLQSDCNLPSGESFARHGLYSQRYFLQRFGKMAKVGYNVDSFGHVNSLPQILQQSGMDYYLFMRPVARENDRIPLLFEWESPDGSRVTTYRLPYSYAFWDGPMDPEAQGSNERQKIISGSKLAEQCGHDVMILYGVGNHGGGPTIKNIKDIQEYQAKLGKDRVLFSSPDAYFAEVTKQDLDLPVFTEPLQPTSQGAYTSHSETKKSNRKAEHRLLNAEKINAVASILTAHRSRQSELAYAWENVLFNHFHDLFCGTSIEIAYEDAREFYGEALAKSAKVLNDALQRITWSVNTAVEGVPVLDKSDDIRIWEKNNHGVPVVVYNPLSWPVQAPLQINKTVRKVTDDAGNLMEIQHVRGTGSHTQEMFDKWETVILGDIPAMGYRVYWIYRALGSPMFKPNIAPDKKQNVLENDHVMLEFDPHTGHMVKLFDKKNQLEVLSGKGAVPAVNDDYESSPWGGKFNEQLAVFADATVELLEDGPMRGKLRVTNRYNDSVLRQDFILYKDRPDVHVQLRLDWREKNKMLKLSFPVNVSSPRATLELPYGFVERPVTGAEEPGLQWVDVTGQTAGGKPYGLALLNDAKYGYDVKDSTLRMTVARSVTYSSKGDVHDRHLEFLDMGMQHFEYMLVPHAGDWRCAGVVKKAYELNVPPIQVVETYHEGPLPQTFEGISISADNVVATAFKIAEDGDGYILRCYETNGTPAKAAIKLPMLGREFKADFGKCQIKTFRIPADATKAVSENNLLEMPRGD